MHNTESVDTLSSLEHALSRAGQLGPDREAPWPDDLPMSSLHEPRSQKARGLCGTCKEEPSWHRGAFDGVKHDCASLACVESTSLSFCLVCVSGECGCLCVGVRDREKERDRERERKR